MNLPPLPALKWECLCTKCGKSWIVDEKPTAPECMCGYMPHVMLCDKYTAEQVRQAQRDAVAAAVPEGWKLVPIEPTEEMLRAGGLWGEWKPGGYRDLGDAEASYADLIAAAPGGER